MKNEELWLTAAIAPVYALVPSLGMPGYVRVWGGGAVVFLVLAGVLVAVGRKARRD